MKPIVKYYFLLLCINQLCFPIDSDMVFDFFDHHIDQPAYKYFWKFIFLKEKANFTDKNNDKEEKSRSEDVSVDTSSENKKMQRLIEKQYGTSEERKKIRKEQEGRKQPHTQKKRLGIKKTLILAVAVIGGGIGVVFFVIPVGLSWLFAKAVKEFPK